MEYHILSENEDYEERPFERIASFTYEADRGYYLDNLRERFPDCTFIAEDDDGETTTETN